VYPMNTFFSVFLRSASSPSPCPRLLSLVLPNHRLVQKDVGGEGESLWLLATESVAPEDACWPPLNPAAARQLLGGISSLSTVSKQVARAALAVSNTLPLKVGGWVDALGTGRLQARMCALCFRLRSLACRCRRTEAETNCVPRFLC
jgi:hypothetical protein